ncbi:MAG: hypothetical protein NC122_01750 [Faecalibacterium sp.]|nr:hypothetical protein [Ruminococcus sp.]MCM1391348.1 hypothetical protein [Ruminococcus sp.]MCM1484907.1 hypothetical protein [Faecalibacterium sp.]
MKYKRCRRTEPPAIDDIYVNYGLTGKTIKVLHINGETNYIFWGSDIREMKVEAETDRFFVLTVLPYRKSQNGAMSKPYRETIDKMKVVFQKDNNCINIGALNPIEVFIISTDEALPIKTCNIRVMVLEDEFKNKVEFEKLNTLTVSDEKYYIVRPLNAESEPTLILKETSSNCYESIEQSEETEILNIIADNNVA